MSAPQTLIHWTDFESPDEKVRNAEHSLSILCATVWPGSSAVVQHVSGGLSNHSFLVAIENGRYFVQIQEPSANGSTLSMCREGQVAWAIRAHDLRIGPRLVSCGHTNGHDYLVTDFVPSTTLKRSDGAFPSGALGLLGESLRTLHESAPIPGPFSWAADAVSGVRRFCAEVERSSPEVIRCIELSLELADNAEAVRGPYTKSPCHADLLPENILWDGTAIQLIDWEYSGMGDPLFDLADFCAKAELSVSDAKQVVSGWGGRFDEIYPVLRAYLPISLMREAMWAYRAHDVRWRTDVDYITYARDRVRVTQKILASSYWPFGRMTR
ncbi:phosphotransferase (plasmid) [Mycobacterium sp. TJFP1]